MNEHIARYREGDDAAFNEPYFALQSYINWLAEKYGDQRRFDKQDAVSVAHEALAQALEDWNPEQGYKYFYHYAKQRMAWKVSTERNKVIHREKIAHTTGVDHRELQNEDPMDWTSRLEARDLLDRMLEAADPQLLEMIELKASGLSNVQAGREMGLHNSYLSRRLGELHAHL